MTQTIAHAQPKPLTVPSMRGRWWLVQTRPLYERRLARDLETAGIDYFLPMTQVRRSRLDRGKPRTVREDRPLFPCYLFACAPAGDKPDAASRSLATIRVIPVPDQEGLASDLANLERALSLDPSLTARTAVRAGQRVRINDGALEGHEGIVLDQSGGHCYVQVEVRILGQAVPAKVPAELIEAL